MKTKSLILAMILVVFVASTGDCETAYESYKNGLAMLDQGMKTNDTTSIESSIELFTVAIEGFKDDKKRASGFTKRGVAYGMIGRTDLAIQDFTESLKLWDHDFPRQTRGCMYFFRGENDLAKKDFEKVCARDPNSDACRSLDALKDGKLDEVCTQ